MDHQARSSVLGVVMMLLLVTLTLGSLQPSAFERARGDLSQILQNQNGLHPAGRPIPQPLWDELSKADRYELLSLEPGMPDPADPALFHQFHILGRTDITSPNRKLLNDALDTGVRESRGWKALCFEPRHGLRVSHGASTTDLVICFRCLQVRVYRDGEGVGSLLTTDSPEPTFDAILQQHNVALSPKSR
jgi:hypothetical protein